MLYYLKSCSQNVLIELSGFMLLHYLYNDGFFYLQLCAHIGILLVSNQPKVGLYYYLSLLVNYDLLS